MQNGLAVFGHFDSIFKAGTAGAPVIWSASAPWKVEQHCASSELFHYWQHCQRSVIVLTAIKGRAFKQKNDGIHHLVKTWARRIVFGAFHSNVKGGRCHGDDLFFLQTLNIYESWSVPPVKKKKKFSFNAESKPLWSLNWKVSFNFFSINSTRNIPMEWELWPEFSPKHNFSGPMAWLLVGVMTSVARFSLSSKL